MILTIASISVKILLLLFHSVKPELYKQLLKMLESSSFTGFQRLAHLMSKIQDINL